MKQISKIFNFTSIIPEKENTYNFNPSIARWKEKFYLCAYRSFVRYKSIPGKNYNDNPLFDPNHPWLGGSQATTWWRTVDGEDGTGFFIMEFDEISVKNVRSLNDGNSLYSMESGFPVKTSFSKLKAIDSRLLHLSGDYFLISYNTNFYNQNKCSDGCFIIATRILRLDENGNLYIFKENIMCPTIINRIEKNWSFWIFKNQVYFSYGLTPKHSIYNINININTGEINCNPTPLIENIGYYGKLENVYNAEISEKILFISVTTPAIPKYDNPNRYIGVGHVKYKNDKRYINLIRTTPLGIFYFNTQQLKRHPVYDYLMFIYEFDPLTATITKISDMFIPAETNYILSFPSGIEYSPSGNLMISYGDYDSFSKIILIRKEIINKILKPIVVDNGGLIQNPLPASLSFFAFPTTCFDKSGICSLIDL